MNTDTRIGQYLSITGMIHTDARCATRGRNKGTLLTAEDVAYYESHGVTHEHCVKCSA